MRRHIFEGQKAYVEEYFAKDVASELGLSQTKLIRLAMLLGSDYTEGINGIGGYNTSPEYPKVVCQMLNGSVYS